ncbi:MAG: hypothetical protein IKT06_03505, partial [Aeriscardovia sp.]|nr:hypothetical protein [Aeriscardovia sp.]
MREESTARKNSSKGHGRWKNFFKNISFAQIAASGLSAVTVFFLTSKIGLAGSIIGAVLASIISTISSQLYKNVIDESSRRIKGKRGDEDEGEEDEEGEGGEGGRSPRKGGRKPAKYLKQPEAYANFPRSFPPRGASRGAPPSKPARRTVSGSSAVVPQRSNAPVRTFKKERRKTKKKVVAVSIISSLITLA